MPHLSLSLPDVQEPRWAKNTQEHFHIYRSMSPNYLDPFTQLSFLFFLWHHLPQLWSLPWTFISFSYDLSKKVKESSWGPLKWYLLFLTQSPHCGPKIIGALLICHCFFRYFSSSIFFQNPKVDKVTFHSSPRNHSLIFQLYDSLKLLAFGPVFLASSSAVI